MRKYFPIVMSLVVVGVVFAAITYIKNNEQQATQKDEVFLGDFNSKQACGMPPRFLQQLGIQQPVIIDLSQKKFKGIAFHHGKNMEEILHPKEWESFDSFGTYALDEQGNLYLAPMPYISIKPNTFELQKNIYKLDSMSGKISVLMRLDDVLPGPNNPYGIYTLVYDCEDKTLWVSAIDETDYESQKGVIYHIDPNSKKILQRIEGFDAITLNLLFTSKGKYLLAGSAINDSLYAYRITNGQITANPFKVLELGRANEHIRKIKIKANHYLELQTIPFSYTLIAESTKKYRIIYDAKWDSVGSQWTLSKRE